MRYLATISKKHVFGPQVLQLYSKEVDKYCWMPAKGEIATELANSFKAGTLVVAHITAASGRLQRLEEATIPVIATLHGFSNLSRRMRDLENDIEIWRQSLDIQVQELRQREDDLMRRAEELNLQLTCSLQLPVAS